MSMDGAGGTRLTIEQVAIDWYVTVALKPLSVVVTGSGRSVGKSGLRTTHDVAAGSLTNPGGTPAGFCSTMDTRELVAPVVVHWNEAKPLASVVWVAAPPAPVAGSTHFAGSGLVVAVMFQPLDGTRSSVPESGVRSTYLRTVIDGAHSLNAASRSAASSCEKSATRYTSSRVMSNVPVPENTLGPDTSISRFSDAALLIPAPTATARMWDPCPLMAFAFGTAASLVALLSPCDWTWVVLSGTLVV